MGTPWPPPSSDDLVDGDRSPNYVLRRAVVGLAALAIVAVLGIVGWRALAGDDDSDTTGDTARPWDLVVVQLADGSISVVDRDGEEIATADTELVGVADVGIDGLVVLGLDGDPATDGLAVLSLADGTITELDVSYAEVRRLGRSSLLLAADAAGTGLELIDPATSTTTDLLALADGDRPLADITRVQIDDDAEVLAFTELRDFETVVVDLANDEGVSLPGSLADLAFGRVLTTTNRGDTVLVDLSTTDGERVGTVEMAAFRAVMLVDDARAIAVSSDGLVWRLDFADESVEQVTDLAPVLPVPPGTDPADTRLVAEGVVLADRTRLALFGERFVAFVDADGALVRSVDVPSRQEPFLEPAGAHRCLAVGDDGGPYTLLDAEAGVIVTSFDDGELIADRDDGCVVAYAAASTGDDDLVAGLGLDRRLAGDAVAMSADGTSVVEVTTSAVQVVDVELDERVEVLDPGRQRVRSATFARR
ncbi:MAG: hypothetical protein R2743_23485 [Ilumatobacteraceae bacterium]